MQFKMKDLDVQVQKARNVSSVFLLVFSVSFGFAQKHDNDIISKAEYDVINSVILPRENQIFYIYDTTYFDKTLAIFFEPEEFDLITRKVGIPVSISDDELRQLLTEEIADKIQSEIYLSKPLNLDQKKLNTGILLNNSFDEKSDIRKNVKRITEPIIIDNIAIFRIICYLESSVHILKKENGDWEIKYTFHDWLILE